MIQGRCPTCSGRYQIKAIDDLPAFPFCSKRCRLIDLGRWIDGRYVVPGSPATERTDAAVDDEDADGSA